MRIQAGSARLSALLPHLLHGEHLLIQYSSHQKGKKTEDWTFNLTLESFSNRKQYGLQRNSFSLPPAPTSKNMKISFCGSFGVAYVNSIKSLQCTRKKSHTNTQ